MSSLKILVLASRRKFAAWNSDDRFIQLSRMSTNPAGSVTGGLDARNTEIPQVKPEYRCNAIFPVPYVAEPTDDPDRVINQRGSVKISGGEYRRGGPDHAFFDWAHFIFYWYLSKCL